MAIKEIQYKFINGDSLGSLEAETDMRFLEDAFVEKSELASLKSFDNQIFILLGRTGSGKTAILQKIEEAGNAMVRRISPEDISLNYLSDSKIFDFFRQQDIKLDFVYKQIWKHILIFKVLELHFGRPETSMEKFLNLFRDKIKEATEYVTKFEKGIWQRTEILVKELEADIAKRINTEYKLGIPNPISGLEGNLLEFTWKSTKDQNLSQKDIKDIATRIIQKSTFQETDKIVKISETSIFNSIQKKYYLIIDDLDKDWVNEEIVYDLIKCLIGAIREFKGFKGVKIIIALRENLYRIVINKALETRGGQSEKFDSSTIPLNWTKAELEDLINKRLTSLLKQRYTNNHPTIKDFLSEKDWQYMLDRTLMRPRDLIDFFNRFIIEFVKNTNNTFEISKLALIKDAEKVYSQKRLEALNDEWRENYGNLRLIYGFIARQKTGFTIVTITAHFEAFMSEKHNEMVQNLTFASKFKTQLKEYENSMNIQPLLVKFLTIMYDIGMIGFKDSDTKIQYAHENSGTSLTESNMDVKYKFYVHKMFHLALGIISLGNDRKA